MVFHLLKPLYTGFIHIIFLSWHKAKIDQKNKNKLKQRYPNWNKKTKFIQYFISEKNLKAIYKNFWREGSFRICEVQKIDLHWKKSKLKIFENNESNSHWRFHKRNTNQKVEEENKIWIASAIVITITNVAFNELFLS